MCDLWCILDFQSIRFHIDSIVKVSHMCVIFGVLLDFLSITYLTLVTLIIKEINELLQQIKCSKKIKCALKMCNICFFQSIFSLLLWKIFFRMIRQVRHIFFDEQISVKMDRQDSGTPCASNIPSLRKYSLRWNRGSRSTHDVVAGCLFTGLANIGFGCILSNVWDCVSRMISVELSCISFITFWKFYISIFTDDFNRGSK